MWLQFVRQVPSIWNEFLDAVRWSADVNIMLCPPRGDARRVARSCGALKPSHFRTGLCKAGPPCPLNWGRTLGSVNRELRGGRPHAFCICKGEMPANFEILCFAVGHFWMEKFGGRPWQRLLLRPLWFFSLDAGLFFWRACCVFRSARPFIVSSSSVYGDAFFVDCSQDVPSRPDGTRTDVLASPWFCVALPCIALHCTALRCIAMHC